MANPCTEEAIEKQDMYHPHPLYETMYIQCDNQGNMYVRQCAGGTKFNLVINGCDW